MYLGDISAGWVDWTSGNVVQYPFPGFMVGYLPTKRILPDCRRWLERWHRVGQRIAVVTPQWGVEGHWAFNDDDFRRFGVKKIPTTRSTLVLPDQPVLVLWDRPHNLSADAIRIIR